MIARLLVLGVAVAAVLVVLLVIVWRKKSGMSTSGTDPLFRRHPQLAASTWNSGVELVDSFSDQVGYGLSALYVRPVVQPVRTL